jgi:SAM-dependent methyltransferase
MFRNLLKKKESTENVGGVVEPKEQEVKQQTEQLVEEPISSEPIVDETPEVETAVENEAVFTTSPEDIDTDGFDAQINLDDVGAVDDIDEVALKEELQTAIAEELMKADGDLDVLEEEAQVMEDNMTESTGITQAEWEDTYNNLDLIGYSDRMEQASVFENIIPDEFDVWADTLLDVGCAVGDLSAYLIEVLECAEPYYYGLDAEESMIDLAKTKFPQFENNFIHGNILSYTPEEDTKYDWIVAGSAFNELVEGEDDMNEYLKRAIDKMYQLAEKGVSLNLLSEWDIDDNDDEWKKYFTKYDPVEIFKWAVDKYKNVKIHNDYIERDFVLTIYK